MLETLRSLASKTPPVGVIRAVNRIRDGVARANRRLAPSSIALLELATGFWISQAIHVVAVLKISDLLRDGPLPVEELARLSGAKAEPLFRVLRALAAQGVFTEVEPRSFARTPLARGLDSEASGSMRDMILYQGGLNWSHWGELLHCVRTGGTAVEKVRGTDFWSLLKSKPEESAHFDRAMTGISELGLAPLLDCGYDFGLHGIIVDVGGGHGRLLSAILERYPLVKGVLFDQPHVLREAVLPADRARAVGGSFLESVPEGGDAYLLKHILHDWDEAHALRILANIRKVIEPGARLLVVESVVPAGNEPHFSKLIDLEMLVTVGGAERTEQGYRELLRKCGFALERVVPTAAPHSLLVAKPV